MSTPSTPKPPAFLGPDGRRVWRTINREFELSPSELAICEQLAAAYEHSLAAWRTLSAEGLTVEDRYGAAKQHPSVATASTFSTLTARLAKQLGVELAESDQVKLKGRGPGRPVVTRMRKAA